MKKLIAIAMALTLCCSCITIASAADATTLTTTVPDATYTLNIPADQEIPFGETETDIGSVTVTEAAGFAEGKNLRVTLTYDGSFSADDVSTSIPYTINKAAMQSSTIGGPSDAPIKYPVSSGDYLVFKGYYNGSVAEGFAIDADGYNVTNKHLEVVILSEDWGKALAGDYSSTITFTAEVVVSEP